MWADTLQLAERAHLLRLGLWGGASLLAGSSLVAAVRMRGNRSALLEQFGIQTGLWGLIELGIALLSERSLTLRDLAGATRLDRMVWLNIGLDTGYVLVGLTVAVLGWRLIRRPGVVGAGIGVIVQGTALAVLDLVLAGQISR